MSHSWSVVKGMFSYPAWGCFCSFSFHWPFLFVPSIWNTAGFSLLEKSFNSFARESEMTRHKILVVLFTFCGLTLWSHRLSPDVGNPNKSHVKECDSSAGTSYSVENLPAVPVKPGPRWRINFVGLQIETLHRRRVWFFPGFVERHEGGGLGN